MKLAIARKILENSIHKENKRLEITQRTVLDMIGERTQPEPDLHKSEELKKKIKDHMDSIESSQKSPKVE